MRTNFPRSGDRTRRPVLALNGQLSESICWVAAASAKWLSWIWPAPADALTAIMIDDQLNAGRTAVETVPGGMVALKLVNRLSDWALGNACQSGKSVMDRV